MHFVRGEKRGQIRVSTISRAWTISALSICLLACLATQKLRGQAATATITGTVTDSSGASVPGASVNAKNTGTGITRTTTSDAQGRYNLPDLAIGDYDV